MEPTPIDVGRNVRAARISAGLTQQRLAACAGVSFQTVRNIEQGRVRQPSITVVHRLAEALGCSIDELVTGAAA